MQARMWGKLPSEMAGISDPVVAFAVDDALFYRVLVEEKRSGAGSAVAVATDADYAD